MNKKYQLFRRTPSAWMGLLIATVCAVLLMTIDGSKGRLYPLRTVLSTVTAPITIGLNTTFHGAQKLLTHLYAIGSLTIENAKLQTDLAQTTAQLVLLNQVQEENAELKAALGLQKQQVIPSITAQVLYQVIDPYSRKLVLNKGIGDGVVAGQPVVTADGLVGLITNVMPLTSELTLILDTRINVPVRVLRSPEVRGFLSGSREEGFLEVRFFSKQADLQKDDVFVTSGLDGLYPQGLPVARVRDIQTSADGRSEVTLVPTTQGMSVHYVSILKIAEASVAQARNESQAELVVTDQIPISLGARTREQTVEKGGK